MVLHPTDSWRIDQLFDIFEHVRLTQRRRQKTRIPMKKLPSGITMYWTAVLGLFFYFSVAYFDAGMPLDWEEAVLSAPAAEILAGTDLDPMYSTLSIGGRNWPVLEAIHGIGVLETYLMLPIFRLFGISPYVLRAVEVMGC